MHLLIFFTPRSGHCAVVSHTLLPCASVPLTHQLASQIHSWNSACGPATRRKTEPCFLPSLSPWLPIAAAHFKTMDSLLPDFFFFFFFAISLFFASIFFQDAPIEAKSRHLLRLPAQISSLQAHPRLFTKTPSAGDGPPPSDVTACGLKISCTASDSAPLKRNSRQLILAAEEETKALTSFNFELVSFKTYADIFTA